jgi:Protein of unknown function (DUF3224)
MRTAAIVLSLVCALVVKAEEGSVTKHAKGMFEVTLKPLTAYDETAGRMSIDKVFNGDLAGTSKGEMLTAMTATKGSAGYVAIETFTGTVNGRKGTFMLQHTGVMTRGTPSLTIAIVPDSGTGELAGIAGTMAIDMSGGKHAYDLEYTLP